jgi:hypothetical protein
MAVTVYVKHRVADFESWKKVFDERAEARSAQGCLGTTVFRDVNEPSVIVVLARMKDLETAKRYMRQTELVDGMWRAGVAQAPEVRYLDEIESAE